VSAQNWCRYQLANFPVSMDLPDKSEKDAANAVGKSFGQVTLQERINEIKKIIERVDFRWDMGFMN
jgi:hypothetical protein